MNDLSVIMKKLNSNLDENYILMTKLHNNIYDLEFKYKSINCKVIYCDFDNDLFEIKSNNGTDLEYGDSVIFLSLNELAIILENQ